MNRLTRPELIAAILDLCTLDHTYTAESLDRESMDILRSILSTLKRQWAIWKAEWEEEEEARSRQMPSWAMSESELGPDPRDAAW